MDELRLHVSTRIGLKKGVLKVDTYVRYDSIYVKFLCIHTYLCRNSIKNMNRDAKFQISESKYFLDRRKKLRRGQTYQELKLYLICFITLKNSETNKSKY